MRENAACRVEFPIPLHTNWVCCLTSQYSVNQLAYINWHTNLHLHFPLAINLSEVLSTACMVVFSYSHKQLQVYSLICWFIYDFMVFSEELDLYRTGKKWKTNWIELTGKGNWFHIINMVKLSSTDSHVPKWT